MSWMDALMSVLMFIRDPEDRVYLASTINYLLQEYEQGHLSEEELRANIIGELKDVIALNAPELSEDEVLEKARQIADEIIRRYRVKRSFRRLRSRLGGRM